MPKYAIHHVVVTESIRNLHAHPESPARAAASVLASQPGMANLGAVGPDLFFWAPDYEIVDKLFQLYKNIDKVVGVYDDIVRPFRQIRDATIDHLGDTVRSLAPATVRQIEILLEQTRQTSRLFQGALGNGLFAGVISGANLVADAGNLPTLSARFFELFKPPLQNNEDEKRWYWFDMLHYRRTGHFGRKLVEHSRGGSAEARAFALGYLSHVATDLIGHPYVNQVVGGPYRLQIQRHVTVENFMDTWKFARYYPGENINQRLFDKLGLPPALPPAVGDLLHRSFSDVYATGPRPQRLGGTGFLSRDQIDQTYEIFFKVLQLLQRMAIARPEEPFSQVAAELSAALDNLIQPPPNPPGPPPGACSWQEHPLVRPDRQLAGLLRELLPRAQEMAGVRGKAPRLGVRDPVPAPRFPPGPAAGPGGVESPRDPLCHPAPVLPGLSGRALSACAGGLHLPRAGRSRLQSRLEPHHPISLLAGRMLRG